MCNASHTKICLKIVECLAETHIKNIYGITNISIWTWHTYWPNHDTRYQCEERGASLKSHCHLQLLAIITGFVNCRWTGNCHSQFTVYSLRSTVYSFRLTGKWCGPKICQNARPPKVFLSTFKNSLRHGHAAATTAATTTTGDTFATTASPKCLSKPQKFYKLAEYHKLWLVTIWSRRNNKNRFTVVVAFN